MNYYLDKYPFAAIVSRELLPEFKRFGSQDMGWDDEKEIPLLSEWLHKTIWKDEKSFEDNMKRLIKFLFRATMDQSQALQLAEDQLSAIIRRDPFIPEYFGFEESSNGVYTKDDIILEQIGGGRYRITFSDNMEFDLMIPTALIGFFVMASLGIVSFESNLNIEENG